MLDFTVNAAGPYAAWLLAALGADVIKVESHSRPDPVRGSEDRPYIHSNFFEDTNTGKRTVALDLKTAAGREAGLELAVRCDAVMSSFRPGVMDRLGLSSATIIERRPAAVVASFSATGSAGPHAGLPGFAGIFNALGGLGALTGYVDGPPTELRTSIDMRAGAMFSAMIVAALREARLTGVGRAIDFAATEAVALLSGEFLTASLLGSEDFEQRVGNRDEMWAPQGTYATRDGRWVALAVRTDDEWDRLVTVFGDGTRDTATFGTAAQRRQAADAVDEIVGGWADRFDAEDFAERLSAVGTAATVVRTADEIAGDPQLSARGFFTTTPGMRGNADVAVGSAPWTTNGQRPTFSPGRPLGADTATVLTEVLGIPPAEAIQRAAELDEGVALARSGS